MKNYWDNYEFSDPVSPFSWPVRRVITLAALVALVCATLVFFALKNRDSALFLRVEAPKRNVNTSPEAAKGSNPTVSESPEISSPPAPAPLKRTFFKIRRSRRFHSFGPLQIRLSRLNPTRPDLDVSLNVNGRRIEKRHVGLEQPIVIEATNSAPALKVVFNRMTKDQVFGYVFE